MRKYWLKSIPHGNCTVCMQDAEMPHEIWLRSYKTDVLMITIHDDNTITAFCTGTYSTTTRRHINRFTMEFFGRNMQHYFKDHIGEELDMTAFRYDVFHALEWYNNQGKRKFF